MYISQTAEISQLRSYAVILPNSERQCLTVFLSLITELCPSGCANICKMLSKPTEKEEEAAISRAAKMISMEAAVTSWQFLREFLFSSCFLIHPFLWQTEPKPTSNLAAANGGAES